MKGKEMLEGDEKDNEESKSWFGRLSDDGPRDTCMVCGSSQPRYSIVHSAFLTSQQLAVMGIWLCQSCLEKFHRDGSRNEAELKYEMLCLQWASEGYDGSCFGKQDQRALGAQIIDARQVLREVIWEWIDKQRELFIEKKSK